MRSRRLRGRRRRTRRRRRASPASAVANHASRRKRLTKPGPATSARSTSGSAGGRRRDLLRDLARRPPPRAGELQRRVRRVVAVLRVRRPLELELGAGARRERGRERLTGSAANGLAAAKRSSSARSSSGVPTPTITSPGSIRASGSGVVSNVPSALAQRDDDRARLVPDADLADRPPAARARLVDLDLRHVQVGAGRGRHGVEERGHLRLQHEIRHRAARRRCTACTTRSAPASMSFRSASSSDARATIWMSGRAERAESDDVEIVGVGVGGGDEPASRARGRRAADPRPRSRLPSISRSPSLLRGRDRVLAEVEHDVRHAGSRNSSATRRPTRP